MSITRVLHCEYTRQNFSVDVLGSILHNSKTTGNYCIIHHQGLVDSRVMHHPRLSNTAGFTAIKKMRLGPYPQGAHGPASVGGWPGRRAKGSWWECTCSSGKERNYFAIPYLSSIVCYPFSMDAFLWSLKVPFTQRIQPHLCEAAGSPE